MKNAYAELPAGYREIFHLELQKDRKKALLVNGLALLLMAVMLVPALLTVPIGTLFSFEDGMAVYVMKFVVMLAGMVVYMVLHELTHGIFMRGFSGMKPHYGFTGMYAYAGSEACFAKMPYIVIALAPIVIWGVVLLVINLLVPQGWFYPVYLIQMINISGAAGDLYVTAKFSKMPKDILVNDTGTAMTVYSKANS